MTGTKPRTIVEIIGARPALRNAGGKRPIEDSSSRTIRFVDYVPEPRSVPHPMLIDSTMDIVRHQRSRR